MRKLILLALFSLVMAPTTSEAAPISVNCPNTPATTDREFTLTTDPVGATCLTWGNGSDELNLNVHDLILAAGWTAIDKDPSDEALALDAFFSLTGLGSTSGSFLIDPALWAMFDELAIGFKVGGGPTSPKWAVFVLPEGETAGLWSNAPQQGGGLSHANLYGRGPVVNPNCTDTSTCPDVTAVPEPATLLLLGSGLTFAARLRAKRAKR